MLNTSSDISTINTIFHNEITRFQHFAASVATAALLPSFNTGAECVCLSFKDRGWQGEKER